MYPCNMYLTCHLQVLVRPAPRPWCEGTTRFPVRPYRPLRKRAGQQNGAESRNHIKQRGPARSVGDLASVSLSDTASEGNPESSERKGLRGKAVVVGAGPAGALATIVLAQRGFDVEVYELRPEPNPYKDNKDRSYVIGVSYRGLTAAEEANVDMTKFRRFPYRGGTNGNYKGEHVSTVFHEPIDAKVLAERGELVRHFLDEVKRLDLHSRVIFHWEAECTGVDLERQLVTFRHTDGSVVEERFDLLVGADGINSRVRKELVRQVPDMRETWAGLKHRIDKFFHKVPVPPNVAWEAKPAHADLEDSSSILRFFTVKAPPGLSIGIFHIVNNEDGTYSGGLSYAKADGQDQTGGNFRTLDDYVAALSLLEVYPEEFRRMIAEQLVDRPWYNTGTTLQVSRLHAGRAVLIGDAAHAVSAAMGQGLNSSLEDCTLLSEALNGCPDDIDTALHLYENKRFKDTAALGKLDREVMAYLGQKGKMNLSYIIYQIHLVVNGFLHRILPQFFGAPDISRMVTMQKIPYSAVERRIYTPFVTVCTFVSLLGVAVALKGAGCM